VLPFPTFDLAAKILVVLERSSSKAPPDPFCGSAAESATLRIGENTYLPEPESATNNVDSSQSI
jgi:hypothetical protein